MNVDGSDLRQLIGEFSTSPAWSPDGSRIAYLTADGAISVANADGTDARRLTAPPTSYTDERPSWSPDGGALAFARRQTFGNDPQLHVVDADGSNERQVTSTEGASRFPSWSPDGTQIVFTHIGRLSVIGADGSGMRPLLEQWGEDLAPDWGTSTIVPDPQVPGAPTIQILSPEAQVYPSGYEVGAFYHCESATSFVVSCEGDVPMGAPVDTETAGHHTFTVRATDAEGRTSTKTVDYEVLDWRAPTVVVRTPADGAEYELGEPVEVDYECADEPDGSGIELCAGELQRGQPLDTSRVGSFTVRFWAVDRANNVNEISVAYRIVYAFSGFSHPVSPEAGEALPVKFSLGGDRGLGVVTGASWTRVDCRNGTPLGDASAATGKLSYQNGRYKLLVKTRESWEGRCLRLAVAFDDGTTQLDSIRFDD